ncbi:MAG: BREX-1 system phosphatase PglZ type B, partial [Candidatus Accumulibacter sp.]|nr:BREX-1 system phosphatase PglZ type B [Accumulibacter sp.]
MDGLVLRLREQARRFNPSLEMAPVVVLWTDEKREWEGIVPRVKEALPELYSLGPYMPDGRSGPGVWLRMVADRQAGSIGASETPILYLPGV